MSPLALITGASRGVGEASALALARAGWTVGLLARSAERLEALAERIEETGGSAVVCTADIAEAEAVKRAVERLVERAGPISAVVNNAGVVERIAPITQLGPGDFGRTLAVNLHGAFHAVHAALPSMLAGGGPTSIVQVSSGAAHRPLDGWTSYCVSKAGLWMLTQALHHELHTRGVAVYGFQPGTVDTQMQADIRRSGINPVSRMTRDQHLPPAVPGECIAWLLEARPLDWVGQDLRVDTVRQRAGL